MEKINIHDAKTHLSRLVDRAAAGEDIVIARNGTPVARLTQIMRTRRLPGRLKGRIRIRADFESPLPDSLVRAFRGQAK